MAVGESGSGSGKWPAGCGCRSPSYSLHAGLLGYLHTIYRRGPRSQPELALCRPDRVVTLLYSFLRIYQEGLEMVKAELCTVLFPYCTASLAAKMFG